jgi:hypothetical protein
MCSDCAPYDVAMCSDCGSFAYLTQTSFLCKLGGRGLERLFYRLYHTQQRTQPLCEAGSAIVTAADHAICLLIACALSVSTFLSPVFDHNAVYLGSFSDGDNRSKANCIIVDEDVISGMDVVGTPAVASSSSYAGNISAGSNVPAWQDEGGLANVLSQAKTSTKIFMYNLFVTFELARGIGEVQEAAAPKGFLESIQIDAVGIEAATMAERRRVDVADDRCR